MRWSLLGHHARLSMGLGGGRASPSYISTSATGAASGLPINVSKKQAQLMEQDTCILVNREDVPIGSASKRECHMIPSGASSPEALPLHRAFSVFLFGGEAHGHRMLIQQRPLHKATFPGLWANACCSHPLVRDRDNIIGAMRRRLEQELGLELDEEGMKTDVEGNGSSNGPTRLTLVGRLTYAARCPVNRAWGEHELDHVYALEMTREPKVEAREEEVAAIRWVSPSELAADIRERPTDYAPWFKVALRDLILPVWTELYHHRRHRPLHQGSDQAQWSAIKPAKIIHYGELS